MMISAVRAEGERVDANQETFGRMNLSNYLVDRARDLT